MPRAGIIYTNKFNDFNDEALWFTGGALGFFKFNIEASEGRARAGRLSTPHGDMETPCFMPVGTRATVKTLSPRDLSEAGAQVILANAYHLYFRPGVEAVAAAGGLHRFMSWEGPLLTDSGGFQVFSLARTAKINGDGVEFSSLYDGSRHFFTPELSTGVQERLGADIIMCFDECVPSGVERHYLKEAVERTAAWAERCKQVHTREDQLLMGIIQGGTDLKLRSESVEKTLAIGFGGYAIGGLSVGEERPATIDSALPLNAYPAWAGVSGFSLTNSLISLISPE